MSHTSQYPTYSKFIERIQILAPQSLVFAYRSRQLVDLRLEDGYLAFALLFDSSQLVHSV